MLYIQISAQQKNPDVIFEKGLLGFLDSPRLQLKQLHCKYFPEKVSNLDGIWALHFCNADADGLTTELCIFL